MPINDEITIVRSGTSLMMKMLEAGGIEPVTDNIRGADLDNPKGYYEFEKVKVVAEDSSWLPATRGKAFKMVSILLRNLPANHPFKLIFMRRKMGEVLASQSKMLVHMGIASGPTNEQMATLFTNRRTARATRRTPESRLRMGSENLKRHEHSGLYLRR